MDLEKNNPETSVSREPPPYSSRDNIDQQDNRTQGYNIRGNPPPYSPRRDSSIQNDPLRENTGLGNPPAYSEHIISSMDDESLRAFFNFRQSQPEEPRIMNRENQANSKKIKDEMMMISINLSLTMCLIFYAMMLFFLKISNGLTHEMQVINAIFFGIITFIISLCGEVYKYRNECKGIFAIRTNFLSVFIFTLMPLVFKFENEIKLIDYSYLQKCNKNIFDYF